MKRLISTLAIALTTALWVPLTATAAPSVQEEKEPLGLKVTVNVAEAGTLFVKIQEQIEELGELTDIGELTVSGILNQDDYNVINNQIPNVTFIDLSGVSNTYDARLKLFNHSRLVTAILPDQLSVISDECFDNCPSLKSVTLPKSLKELPYCAFYGCSALESIVLPDSITSIGPSAFQHCTSLSSVQLPALLQTIGHNAFFNTGFTEFTLPAGVQITGAYAFASCRKLTSFTFTDGLTGNGDLGASTFEDCAVLQTVRLPQTLQTIPDYFFKNTPISITEWPVALRKIGVQAFYGTPNMKKVVLPDYITELQTGVFEWSSIEEVTWPAGATTIPNEAFRDCRSLRSVTIPATVTKISDQAFYQCTALSEITLPPLLTAINGAVFLGCPLTHVDIPDGVTDIAGWAFRWTALTGELVLPSKLQTIGANAFDCGSYTRVVVPEGAIRIGGECFRNDSLRYLELPSTLLIMGPNQVGGSWYSACDTVIIKAAIPPSVNGNFFPHQAAKDTCTLFVPAETIDLYRASISFGDAHEIKPLGNVHATVLNISSPTTITAASGLQSQKWDEVNISSARYFPSSWDETFSSDDAYLNIAEGAKLSTKLFTMRFDRDNYDRWDTDYEWQSFINRGTADFDQISVKWNMRSLHYFTPSFDTKYQDLVPDYPDYPFAIYRYDGSARAVGNFADSWIKVKANEELKAGVGYVYMGVEVPTGEKDWRGSWTYSFYDVTHLSHPGGQNYFLTTDDITLPVEHYSGEFAHNKNWNLIGQPYPAFLDIRGLDYDGPIFLAHGDSWGRWKVYSPLDDEVVLYPQQAIFVQVPDGTDAITLDADRRQNSVAYKKGGTANSRQALRRADKNARRVVFNATLARVSENSEYSEYSENSDYSEPAHTRFVLNPDATMRYDIGRDAPVMDEEGATLLYTQQDGVALAINERPLADGIVRLGLQLAEAGTYTLALSMKGGSALSSMDGSSALSSMEGGSALSSMDGGSVLSGTAAEKLWLLDSETDTRHLLLDTATGTCAPYTFTATAAGTLSNRFVIAIGDADPTAITDVEAALPLPTQAFFNLAGQRIAAPARGIYINNGKKVVKKD